MIRKASIEDIPTCVEMGRAFFVESGLSKETAFDTGSTAKTMQALIEGPDSLLLVAEVDGSIVGMAAALAYPHYFNVNAKASQELFWWVKPEFRGGLSGAKLLTGIEDWARDVGCQTLTMLDLPAIDGPAKSIYERRGYRACERSFIKVV